MIGYIIIMASLILAIILLVYILMRETNKMKKVEDELQMSYFSNRETFLTFGKVHYICEVKKLTLESEETNDECKSTSRRSTMGIR